MSDLATWLFVISTDKMTTEYNDVMVYFGLNRFVSFDREDGLLLDKEVGVYIIDHTLTRAFQAGIGVQPPPQILIYNSAPRRIHDAIDTCA